MLSFYICVSCHTISYWRDVDNVYDSRIILKSVLAGILCHTDALTSC